MDVYPPPMPPAERAVLNRVLSRWESLGSRFAAMKNFRAADYPREDFVTYESGVTWSVDPDFRSKERAFRERLKKEPMAGVLASKLWPQEKIKTIGPDGVILEVRIDPVATPFPLILPDEWIFGAYRFNMIDMEGPPSDAFDDLRYAILTAVEEECARFGA